MDNAVKQKTGIRRLWEQIVGLFKWAKERVRNNPLQSVGSSRIRGVKPLALKANLG